MGNREGARRAMGRRRWGLRAAIAALTPALVPVTGIAPPAGAAEVPAQVEAATTEPVRIVYDGTTFTPQVTRVEPGTTILFANEGPGVLVVADIADRFVLSPIPPGGGGVVRLPEAGSYAYADPVTGAAGRVLVGRTGFGAPLTDPVADHVPDAWPPAEPDALRTVDPVTGATASTSQLRLRFVPGTTVAEAEGVLARAGAVVAGGSPSTGLLHVLVAPTPDHSAIRAALDQLLTEPAVDAATRVGVVDIATIPPPVSEPDDQRWQHDPQLGEGGNWGFEASRFPQLWNLTDELRRRVDARAATGGPRVRTMVLDGGFDPAHPNLGTFQFGQLCNTTLTGTTTCTPQTPVPAAGTATKAAETNITHGTHVASIIGGRQSGGKGIDGGNPVADIVAVEKGSFGFLETLDRMLDLQAAGDPTFAAVRVVNISMRDLSLSPGKAGWAAAHPDLTCGPGDDDDALPGTDGPCLPWTHDGHLAEVRRAGALAMPVLRRAAAAGVMIVAAAGNEATSYCIDESILGDTLVATGDDGCPAGSRPLTTDERGVPSSRVTSAITAASFHRTDADGPDPVLVVEALGATANGQPVATTGRAGFSQVEGTLSAPGIVRAATWTYPDGTPKWAGKGGTSQATPMVSAVVGAMLAWDPGLDVETVRANLATFSDSLDPDLALPVAPRIDAFGSLLALPGALEALLDVNDPSADGNRRVVYGPGGAKVADDTTLSSTPGAGAEPDGVIDERDVRRFRDAWLYTCLIEPRDECTEVADLGIDLDGGASNPKLDLNLDGCVATRPPGAACPAADDVFPRVDLNGDGRVSRTAAWPVTVDGTEGSRTDLGVLASRFQPAPEGTGWYAPPEGVEALLDDLLVTGDVEVNVAGFLAAGGADVEVELSLDGTSQFVTPLPAGADVIVLSVPAGRPAEVTIRGERSGQPVEITEALTLQVGEDRRVDACGVLRLTADDEVLALGSSTSVTATLDPCGDGGVSGTPVEFGVRRLGGGGDASITTTPVATGTDGSATTELVAGLVPGSYRVTARSTLPTATGSTPVESSVQVTVADGYRLESIVSRPHSGGASALGTNPSVDADGTVAYTARDAAGEPHRDLYRDRLTSPPEEIGASARAIVGPLATFGDRVDIGPFGRVLWSAEDFDAGSFTTTTWAGSTLGQTATLLATGRRTLGTTTDPFAEVNLPVGGVTRPAIVPVLRNGSAFRSLAQYVGPTGGLVVGPTLGAFWPRHADTADTVVFAQLGGYTYTTPLGTNGTPGLWVGPDTLRSSDPNAGDGTFRGTPIAVVDPPAGVTPDPGNPTYPAEVTGWVGIGRKADISASGDVVAFIGDRGLGSSVYVSVRVGGTYTEPVAVAGPARQGPPELDVAGVLRHLEIDPARDEVNLNVGVVHEPAGPAGLDGDHVVVAVFGHPEQNPVGGGLYTVPLTLLADGTPVLGAARPVIELGDAIDGSPVTGLGWHRVLTPDESADNPTEHYLAFWARTDASDHIVRADWVADTTAAPLGPGTSLPIGSSLPRTLGPGRSLGLHAGVAGTAPTPSAALRPEQLPRPAGCPFLPTDGPPPVAAMVVSTLSPEAGTTLTVTNRSTRNGEPVCATLGAGATEAIVAAGGQLAVRPDPGPLGLQVRPDVPGAAAAQLALDVAPRAGVPPAADAGGPYAIESGTDLRLDASGSTDADGTVADVRWDLDGDGVYDDARGVDPLVTWVELAAMLCGGSCIDSGIYPIAVLVTDDDGLTATATTTVALTVVVQDFTIQLLPADQLVNPGANAEYRVEIGSVGGFTEPVQLSVGPLPAGWTATLGRTTVTAPGSTTLVVRVPADATEAASDVVVTGTSGQLVHSTTGAADVVLGLIPICYETIAGTVVDAVTKEPLADVDVRVEVKNVESGSFYSLNYYLTTDAAGSFAQPDVATPTTLLRVHVGGSTTHHGVAGGYVTGEHRCGDPAELTAELVEREYATVRGRIVEGVADPTDTSRTRAVVPTSTPVAGGPVRVSAPGIGSFPAAGPQPSGADGSYAIEVGLAPPDNGDVGFGSVTAHAPGHWGASISGLTFARGPALEADVPLVEACTVQAGVSGRLTDEAGSPVAGERVRLFGSGGPNQGSTTPLGRVLGDVTTDADGRFAIPAAESYLDHNNAAYDMRIDWSTVYVTDQSFRVERCGDTVVPELDFVRRQPSPPPPPPVKNYGTVVGRAVDAGTGEPVGLGQTVRAYSRDPKNCVPPFTGTCQGLIGSGSVRADGTFEFDVYIGDDAVTVASQVYVAVWEYSPLPGYRGAVLGPFTMGAGQANDVGDVAIEPIAFAGVTGRVVDMVTGEPLPGAFVRLDDTSTRVSGGEARTVVADEQGAYGWRYIVPPSNDAPYSPSLRASTPFVAGRNYWPVTEPVELTPGATVEKDFRLLRICEDVTIRGIVVNAVTRQPIEGVRVAASNASLPQFTDADGFFVFEQLRAGTLNRPTSVRLTASKSGFITQTRDVTVFCGATITVSFGVDTGAGTVVGTVTDDLGNPIAGVFIGSEAGGSATTAADGTYRIADVPLGIDGGPTDWVVTAIHPDGRRQEQTVTVTNGGTTVVDYVFPTVAQPENTPPEADDIAVTVDAGASVGITLTGSDADGDELTFEVVTPPATGTLGGTPPALTYTAPGDGDGVVTFTYRASDGTDVSPEATVTITIVPVVVGPQDRSPVIEPIDDVALDEGATRAVPVTATDPDGDPVTLTASGLPAWASLTDDGGGTGRIDLAPTDEGTAAVTVEACAAGACASTSFDITVANVAPTLTLPAPDPVDEGGSATLAAGATDPGADELTFAADCGGGFGAGQPGGTFTCPFDQDGTYPVTVRVDDGDGGTDTVTVDVVVRNVAPTVTAGNDGPAPWGAEVALTASATDPSAADQAALTYAWDVDGDGTFDTGPSSRPGTTATYAEPGTYLATVRVCDDDACTLAGTDVSVARRPAAIDVTAVGAQYSDPATVSARLADGVDWTPIAGATVTLGLGGATQDAVTGTDGRASGTVAVDRPAGPADASAAFAGDARHEEASAVAEVAVAAEDATLTWRGTSLVLGTEVRLAVDVTEADDGHPGDLSRAAVTFSVFADATCTGPVTVIGPVGVVAGPGGTGSAVTVATGFAGAVCVRASLTAGDDPDTANGYYTAAPVDAVVEVITEGHITGGGRLDGTDGRLSTGFVARVGDGVVSGHVEVVEHGRGRSEVVARSRSLTTLSITDLDGTRDAPWRIAVRADGERRSGAGWVPATIELVAVDEGPGRGDRLLVLVDGAPVAPADGPLEPRPVTGGQVVVHLSRRVA